MNIAVVFAILDLVDRGLDLAEGIGRILRATDAELAAIRDEVTARLEAAVDRMEAQE